MANNIVSNRRNMSAGPLCRARDVASWYGMRRLAFVYWYWPHVAATHYGWHDE